MYTTNKMRLSRRIYTLTPQSDGGKCIVPFVPRKKDEDLTPVGELIQARQDELGLSIRALGERTGVEHTQIAKHKNGGIDPLLSTIVEMAKVANVTPTVMFEAYLGKTADKTTLRSKKLTDALALYESSPEAQEKLAGTVEMLIREIYRIAAE